MTDPPAPNVELLRRTMDEILAHPEQHDQWNWARRTDCGTAYCFAGTACVLSDLDVDWDRVDEDAGEAVSLLTNGEFIPVAARRLLGVDDLTADQLFSAENTAADLKHYVDEICEHGLIREAQDPWSE